MADPLGRAEVRRALDEDQAARDVTTALLGPRADAPATGAFVCEAACVVAGLPVVETVFAELGAGEAVERRAAEGDRAAPGTVLAVARAPARIVLAAERTALNFLQRLSGIATLTRAAVDAVAGTGAVITDTRKTTPGLRALEKYAVRVGGGQNHRAHLADAVLWKDNHWRLLGSGDLAEALRAAPADRPVTVEVESDDQLEQALRAGVTRILADNLPPERVAEWVRRAGPAVAIEASGGIRPEAARAYALAGARYISIGALTHSVPAVPIRLDVA